jgi:hypothetical protein
LLIWLTTDVLGLIALPGVDTSPIEVRLIVAPAAHDWVIEAADRFNAEDHRLNRRPITIRVTRQDGLGVYRQLASTGLSPAPSAWIAEGSFTLDLVNLAARQASGQAAFTAEGSIAQSPLMWGSFADRAAVIDARFSGLNWAALHGASLAPNGWSSLGGQPQWGFFKLALSDPNESAEGLAALLSAAAEFHAKSELSTGDINDARFQQWAQTLIDAVPNFANLGAEPGQALAVRGPSAGDAGLLLESDWLRAAEGLSNWQPLILRYAASAVNFDFPFGVWVGPEPEVVGSDAARQQSNRQAEQEAALLFRDYLVQDAQQRRAEAFGLRPASGSATNADGSLFARWVALGIQPGPPPPIRVSADAVLAALRWVERAAGR